MNDILDGFDNQSIMAATFKELISVLHDPELPYAETNTVLASLSGRISPKVEESIRSAMDTAKAKSAGHDFPAGRIKKVIEHYITDEVPAADKSMTRAQLSVLIEIAERHIGGAKGHEVEVLANLLGRYEATEKLFGGSIEARVLALREQNKDDLDKAISLVLSHIKVQSKVKLILTILDYIKTSGINVSNPNSRLYKVLQDLATLEAKYVSSSSFRTTLTSLLFRSSTQVCLKAREVLILGQMPSYEERRIQMETILKNSVSNNYYGEPGQTGTRSPSAEVLKELSDSRYTVYDVLPSFFSHSDSMVSLGKKTMILCTSIF
jgi:acetyl-CoA carboxylase/biotin carboxylase 1